MVEGVSQARFGRLASQTHLSIHPRCNHSPIRATITMASPITQVFGEPCLAIYMSFLAAFGVAETIMIIIGTSSRRVEVDGREEEKRRERGGGRPSPLFNERLCE